MNGGWPLSRQKLAARSSDVTPIPGIGSLSHRSAFFDRSRRATAPPIAAPKSAPTALRTDRVAQSSFAPESNPTSAPTATMPKKMSFRIVQLPGSQSVLPPRRIASLFAGITAERRAMICCPSPWTTPTGVAVGPCPPDASDLLQQSLAWALTRLLVCATECHWGLISPSQSRVSRRGRNETRA